MTQPRANRLDCALINLTPTLVPFEHIAQQIAAFQERINHIRTQAKLLLANTIEQIFQDMRGFSQIGEAESACTPLDRVSCAKNGVKLLGIRIFDIQIKQKPFHYSQMLCRFLEEHLVELTHVDSHATPRARPSKI